MKTGIAASGVWFCLAAIVLALATERACEAQPASFYDLGTFSAASEPASTQRSVADFSPAFDESGDDAVIRVKWFRFTVTNDIIGELFIDIDMWFYGEGDPALVLFDNAGRLLWEDDGSGSFPKGVAAGLSFGSTGPRTPPTSPQLDGQYGPLSAGTYWLALVAGPTYSSGFTDWDLTTSSELLLSTTGGIEMYMTAGNTTPLPAPSNDLCSGAIEVSEGMNEFVPAWAGSNIGALHDTFTPCYTNAPHPDNRSKEVWVRYVPSVTGLVSMEARGGAGGGALPILTLYPSCEELAVQCAGGGSIGSTLVRLTREVRAGVPLLISLGIRAGYTGPLMLYIDPLAPPCGLEPLPGAVLESELACGGDNLNGGCNSSTRVFDPIAPGQTVTGQLFSTTNSLDTDWFEFTLTERSNVRVTVSSDYMTRTQIRRQGSRPTLCTGLPVLDLLPDTKSRPCDPTSRNLPLNAGSYKMSIGHAFPDNLGCGSGYERYNLTLEASPCETPTFTNAAVGATTCIGGTATLSAEASALGGVSYLWEIGRASGTSISWSSLSDGLLPSWTESGASVSGVRTSTLTVWNVDANAARFFRVRAQACSDVTSNNVSLTVLDEREPACERCRCTADFDDSGGTPDVLDIDAFFTAWLAGTLSADADCSGGTPDVLDISRFFVDWLAGDCV